MKHTRSLGRPHILDKVVLLTDLGVKQLGSVVEVLGVPVGLLTAQLIGLAVHKLNQLPSHTSVSSLLVHVQIIEIHGVSNGPGVSVVDVGGVSKKSSRLVDGNSTVDGLRVIQKPFESGFHHLGGPGRLVEGQVAVEQRLPGVLIGLLNLPNSNRHVCGCSCGCGWRWWL